ncbi:MAG: type 4a pilus biogenesis protein PilO [Candidatus Eisenbacteria bacterium]|nr:type 4a pilus biogenesis protein PilO [Candidatus Eisenbacteria bacterium]
MKARFRPEIVVALAVMLTLIVADAKVARPRRVAAAEARQRVEQYEQELRYLASHSHELAKVGQFLPQPLDENARGDERFLSGVSAEAKRLNLAFTKVEPAGEQPFGNYVMRRYKLQFEGNYQGFASLLRALETTPDIVTVVGLECVSREAIGASRHRATLEVSVIGR